MQLLQHGEEFSTGKLSRVVSKALSIDPICEFLKSLGISNADGGERAGQPGRFDEGVYSVPSLCDVACSEQLEDLIDPGAYVFTPPGIIAVVLTDTCLLYTSPSPRD